MTKKEIALAYLARGWSIIPLWPKSKTAMVKWTQYQARRPTDAEVSAWWDAEPEANIGVITGAISGFIVGDVDPRHGGSVAEMQKDAPSTCVVMTPGGGAHFYYKHPGGRVQKGKPRPGIDRQSDGCYVVAAGSYVVTQDYEGEYHQLTEGELPDAPTWLLGDPSDETIDGHMPGEAWIARTLQDGCPPGTRNDTLARLAGYFAGRAVPLDVATAVLLPWSQRQSGTHVSVEEAVRTVSSIYAKEARQRKTPVGTYVVDDFVQDDEHKPLEALPLSEFLPRYFSETPDWLIPEWLPERTVCFLVSPPGRYKTMLTFDIAISVAGGFPFLGQYPVQRPGPVLVIQQEDDYGDMARRFNRIFAARVPAVEPSDADDDTVGCLPGGAGLPSVYICTTRGFCLTATGLRRLEDLIRKIRPRVVVIDPLYSITSAEDFMMTAARDMMPLKGLRDAYDVTFLIAAHTKKGAGGDREGLWGSQFLNAFLETGWQIRDREDGEPNQVTVRRHYKSSGQPLPLNLEFLLDDNEGYKVVVTEAEDEGPQDVVVRELAKAGKEGLTIADLAERTGLNVNTTKSRCNKFRKKGILIAWEHPGSATTYALPEDKTEEIAGG